MDICEACSAVVGAGGSVNNPAPPHADNVSEGDGNGKD